MDKITDDLTYYGGEFYTNIKNCVTIFILTFAIVFSLGFNTNIVYPPDLIYLFSFILVPVLLDLLLRLRFSNKVPNKYYGLSIGIGLAFSFGFLEYDLFNSISVTAFSMFSNHLLPSGIEGITTTVTGGMSANIYTSIVISIMVTFPVLVYEFWNVVSPALTETKDKIEIEINGEEEEIEIDGIDDIKGEKDVARLYLFPTIVLFFLGSFMAFYFFLPIVFSFLFSWPEALGFSGKITPINLMTFALWVMVAMGLVFETPVAMKGLSDIGAVTYEKWKRLAPIIIGIMWGVFAFITPADIFSCLMMWVPFVCLYFIGLYLCKI